MTPSPSEQARHSDENPFLALPLEVTVRVGRSTMLLRDILALEENAILLLDRRVEDPVELYIGDKLIARGQLQEAEDYPGQLAICLTEVSHAAPTL